MAHPILVTGAAGGAQGSTGRRITGMLPQQGIPVRALVHKLDSRSDELWQQGAEVVKGDLLDSASVHSAMRISGGPTSRIPSPTACLRPPRPSPQPLAMRPWNSW